MSGSTSPRCCFLLSPYCKRSFSAFYRFTSCLSPVDTALLSLSHGLELFPVDISFTDVFSFFTDCLSPIDAFLLSFSWILDVLC